MNVLKKMVLVAIALGTLSTLGCYRYSVDQGPRVVVDTVQTRRCFGKRYTYICRHPEGHVRREVIRCHRHGRSYVRRRRWIVRDRRCYRRVRYQARHQDPPPREIIP